MRNDTYAKRIEAARRSAYGNWTDILGSLGVDPAILKRRNLPCPLCGGVDRFQYTDKYGEGNYHCRKCGPGGGFKLLQAVKDIDFHTALLAVEQYLGTAPPRREHRQEPSSAHMRELAQRIWEEAKSVVSGDEVDRYLTGRGLMLSVFPQTIRFHPALGYYEKQSNGKSRKVAEYPAMLAYLQGPDGRLVTLHRTYLQNGGKAPIPDVKKVLSSGVEGGAVRLYEPTDELSITEGLEKAFAVHLATQRPTLSAIHADNLGKLCVPDTVKRVWIYADNDAHSDFAGQAEAYALARRLKRERIPTGTRDVQVHIPKQPGIDWDDIWRARVTNVRRAA